MSLGVYSDTEGVSTSNRTQGEQQATVQIDNTWKKGGARGYKPRGTLWNVTSHGMVSNVYKAVQRHEEATFNTKLRNEDDEQCRRDWARKPRKLPKRLLWEVPLVRGEASKYQQRRRCYVEPYVPPPLRPLVQSAPPSARSIVARVNALQTSIDFRPLQT
ncbi:hypothetical protein M404DRAFT_510739 [Pisolithus tinctorius Marx 270]|uniref:Uncharacterized protein n=1 Tax=Pisolithus tinctorius Marx 270 TaxID=870435 RepID=A0A0C3NC86_PISTI|nr:hypothetical protein M404DRAFT_510739 [Pisolithus tinctorius Marx 270]